MRAPAAALVLLALLLAGCDGGENDAAPATREAAPAATGREEDGATSSAGSRRSSTRCSGLHRSIPSLGRTPALVDLVQTDAAISPGSSGGALVGGDGAVIGMALTPDVARSFDCAAATGARSS